MQGTSLMRWPIFSELTTGHRAVLSLPVVAASAVLYWLSSIPDLSTPDLGFSWQDKIYHAIAYFVYGIAVQLAVVAWSRTSTPNRLEAVVVVLIGSLYGLSDEIHQTFVIGRDGSLADLVADVVGVTLSLLLLPTVRRSLLHRSPSYRS